MAKRNRDWQPVCYYDGIDDEGKTRTVSVYRKGTSYRLEMFNPKTLKTLREIVHPTNAGTPGGLEREIDLCWKLKDLKWKPAR